MGESTRILNLQTELKYLDLFKCYNIWTDLGEHPPWEWVTWVDGCGCGCMILAWMHTHMHMHVVKYDKHGCLHGGGHLQFMYILVLLMCICMCTCAWKRHDIGRLTHTHYPHTHTPTRARMAQITKYAIEWIKITQFCLKIWDLCTFLHLFRLGLVCR